MTHAAGLRLLVELTMRRDGRGPMTRWRRYTPAEIAAGIRSHGVDEDQGALESVILGLLDGERAEIPEHLVAPLAAFFGAPVTDLTDDPDVAETAILERRMVELGARGVLFCRAHLTRPVANRLLRSLLDVLNDHFDHSPTA